MKEVLKVKVIEGYEKEFEQYCHKHRIFFKSYPKPIFLTYHVECKREKLHDIGYGIATIEAMPMVALS